MSTPRPVYAGIDAGGSRTVMVVLDASGVELARRVSGPTGFQDLGPFEAAERIVAQLDELLAALKPGPSGGAVGRFVCAMAGAGRREAAEQLERALAEARVADQVAVVTDARAALQAAFGTGPGIVLIAGTGSIAVGRNGDGRVGRAGGLRPAGGDPGSGEWLGRQALEAARREAPGPLQDAVVAEAGMPDASGLEAWERTASRDRVARLAQGVCAAADAGDTAAASLVARAGEALAVLAREVEALLAPWSEAPRLALAGGLLEPGRPVRDAVIAALARGAPGFEVAPDFVDGALGAARLALHGGFAPEAEA